jgi:hypothetical protein
MVQPGTIRHQEEWEELARNKKGKTVGTQMTFHSPICIKQKQYQKNKRTKKQIRRQYKFSTRKSLGYISDLAHTFPMACRLH